MAKLICTAMTSLDGYIADEHGEFDWAAPDSDVHAFVNDLERPIGTYLYGRRLYELMVFWETAGPQPNQPPPVPSSGPSFGPSLGPGGVSAETVRLIPSTAIEPFSTTYRAIPSGRVMRTWSQCSAGVREMIVAVASTCPCTR